MSLPTAVIVAVGAAVAGLAAALIVSIGHSNRDARASTTTEPSIVHQQGKDIVGDSAIRVVTVDVNGRSVPCVLYDGYQSVAIDCLPELP
jgi:hypothetical protein